jgi:hypothetical protein
MCRTQDYGARWDEIAGVFAKEAVLQGSFDKYAESTKSKKGTAEVDAAFLSEIEGWRDLLARHIALRNGALSQRELNYAVQATIDRLIFLRICEDRGTEAYGRLQALLNGQNTYARLLSLYREADQRYNSGLFHFERERGRHEAPDELTPSLSLDDKPLKEIIGRLYYPDSPYEFSVLPADILGQVYEQFLGKVIRLTDRHRAVVEDKPEVKKAGGVYYTPTYIVDYIVKNTVGKLLEGKSPKQAASLHILDPACGSGSFLIGAYQCLLDWHRDWYVADGPAKHTKELFQGPGGEWRLTTGVKKQILLNNVYGVDIDAQAVETTKLSLLLKVLEGETAESISSQLSFLRERALPDLTANIKCGNSLIGPDFYDDQQLGLLLDEEERYRINVFDWQAEFPQILGAGMPGAKRGFDAVIGNPPYVNAWEMFVSDPRSREYLGAPGRYLTAERHWDLYVLFLERGLQLVRSGGRLSYIIPFAFAIQKYGMGAREMLLTRHTLESVADLRTVKVFGAVPVITIVPVVVKSPPSQGAKIDVLRPRVGASPRQVLGIEPSHDVPQAAMLAQHERMLRLDLSDLALGLCERVDRLSVPLGQLMHVNYGAQMSSKQKGAFGKDHVIRDSAESPTCKPLVSGRELYRYRLEWSGRYVEYALAAEMYGARWPEFFEQPKLMIRDITGTHRLETTLDEAGFYCDHTILCAHRAVDIASSKAVTATAIAASGAYALPAIQGLVSSRLVSAYYYFVLTGEGVRTGGGFHTYPTTVRRLPIFDVTRASGAQQQLIDRVGELSAGLLERQRDLHGASSPHELAQLTREVQALDHAIDRLVYQVYGLSDEEVELVESNT